MMNFHEIIKIRCLEFCKSLVLKIDENNLFPGCPGANQILAYFIKQCRFSCSPQTRQHVVRIRFKCILSGHNFRVLYAFPLVGNDCLRMSWFMAIPSSNGDTATTITICRSQSTNKPNFVVQNRQLLVILSITIDNLLFLTS